MGTPGHAHPALARDRQERRARDKNSGGNGRQRGRYQGRLGGVKRNRGEGGRKGKKIRG
jgi:hypothetical protein